ncbi:MAG: tRNA modification GTPase [Pirellulaceae bacterium]|nr:tRNA modification GTPase [Pirellulaceae bacterium]
MLSSSEDTIAAIASPPGGALRGIVRLSGPDAVGCLERCFESAVAERPSELRTARVLPGRLRLEAPLGWLPCQAYIWPGTRSYTRQPVVELHTLGAPVLLDAALDAVCAAGARLARPGEFTLRAFLAGRLDLTQAEAVLGVIDARDQRQLNIALRQLAGGLASRLHDLRDRLLDLLAQLEAGLDFVDEDLEFITAEQLRDQLAAAAGQIAELRRQMVERDELRGQWRVVLRGPPNAGKSSLLNALLGRPAALVSPTAGTTRDFVGSALPIEGLPCLLVDTAGIEPGGSDPLHLQAQAMTEAQRQAADLELYCVDGTQALGAGGGQALLDADGQALLDGGDAGCLLVRTKSDLVPAERRSDEGLWVSSWTGEGLDGLRRAIAQRLVRPGLAEVEVVGTTAARCRESLRLAGEAVCRAERLAAEGQGDELLAVEVRLALDELGQVVGAVYTDDLLDRIFSRFCIGK